VAVLEPEALQFIIDELAQEPVDKVATNKFGCRVLQRLVERCPSAQVSRLVEAVIADFGTIAQHPYGNYVVQHLMAHAVRKHRCEFVRLVECELKSLAADCFGGAVVSGALSSSPPVDQLRIARALVKQGVLVFIACTRHGHVAALQALEVLEGVEQAEARRVLLAELSTLEASRWGLLVLQHLL